jgi:hypothetical protein
MTPSTAHIGLALALVPAGRPGQSKLTKTLSGGQQRQHHLELNVIVCKPRTCSPEWHRASVVVRNGPLTMEVRSPLQYSRRLAIYAILAHPCTPDPLQWSCGSATSV